DWCYFKIYGHPESLNLILRDPALLKLIEGFWKMEGIRRWFFVRYVDPQPHLRIRFQVSKNFGLVISTQLSELVEKYMKSSLVMDFMVATYEPERQRYGCAGMSRVESIFQRSSDLVLTFHQLNCSGTQETCFAFSSVALMLRDFIPDISGRLAFVNGLVKSILVSSSRRRQLDVYYRKHRESLEQAAANPQKHDSDLVSEKLDRFSMRILKFQSTWEGLEEVKHRTLIADLIHMHLNRLNASNRAGLETAVYYLLYKFYRSILSRSVEPIERGRV
ncbi:MAG: hypothetical protein EOP48_10565, partial [Sphingobacteriales bacterium]